MLRQVTGIVWLVMACVVASGVAAGARPSRFEHRPGLAAASA
jgi:hypothetical protein